MKKHCFVVAMLAAVTAATAAGPALAGKATLNLVLVLDGLRPDSITAQETPHLWRLREEGVNFPNGHAVFPTVTRANAAAIGTGVYPSKNLLRRLMDARTIPDQVEDRRPGMTNRNS
jgi:type I phosphodiesterase/nucleotide pyrophosphatase